MNPEYKRTDANDTIGMRRCYYCAASDGWSCTDSELATLGPSGAPCRTEASCLCLVAFLYSILCVSSISKQD